MPHKSVTLEYDHKKVTASDVLGKTAVPHRLTKTRVQTAD